jgi:hypothetical protein
VAVNTANVAVKGSCKGLGAHANFSYDILCMLPTGMHRSELLPTPVAAYMLVVGLASKVGCQEHRPHACAAVVLLRQVHVLNGEKYKEVCPDNTLLNNAQLRGCIIQPNHKKPLLKRESAMGVAEDTRIFLTVEVRAAWLCLDPVDVAVLQLLMRVVHVQVAGVEAQVRLRTFLSIQTGAGIAEPVCCCPSA